MWRSKMEKGKSARLVTQIKKIDWNFSEPCLWRGKAETFLEMMPKKVKPQLIVTSPPYNIGKAYEKQKTLSIYLRQQERIIKSLVKHLDDKGSLCWQVGNYIHKGEITPLDMEFHRIFKKLGLKLRNRIVWRFGHGLHAKRRFSGRYEVILWYTKSDEYKFHLDKVRIPSKYPAKRSYKGVNKGKYSSHPKGKNPEDVWDIPNVKGNHVEKTVHPCQFPVGLVERLVLALTDKNDLVFDPYAGVASAGVAAVHHRRRFVGCEKYREYANVAVKRLNQTLLKKERFRSHKVPIYDHTRSKLSISPKRAKISRAKVGAKRVKRG